MIINFGIEVECGVKHCNFEIGTYHEGIRLNDDWKSENDGSLSFSYYTAVEFVSSIFHREEIKKVINGLKEEIIQDKTDDFKNISINSSCGAHIHFSINNNLMFKKIPIKFLDEIREKTFNKIKNDLPRIYSTFYDHYYRRYSKKIEDLSSISHDRNLEFNFTHDKGVEWRSFNLLGITKWSDMIKMFEIAFDVIIEVLERELDKQKSFFEEYKYEIEIKNSVPILYKKVLTVNNIQKPEKIPLQILEVK